MATVSRDAQRLEWGEGQLELRQLPAKRAAEMRIIESAPATSQSTNFDATISDEALEQALKVLVWQTVAS